MLYESQEIQRPSEAHSNVSVSGALAEVWGSFTDGHVSGCALQRPT